MVGHARQLHGFTIIDALQFTQCQIISEPPQTKKLVILVVKTRHSKLTLLGTYNIMVAGKFSMDGNKEDTGKWLHIGKEGVGVHTREHYPYGAKCYSVITKSKSFFKLLSAVYCLLLIVMYSHAYHLLIEMDYCRLHWQMNYTSSKSTIIHNMMMSKLHGMADDGSFTCNYFQSPHFLCYTSF